MVAARVAEQIGTDPGTISRWERGASSPSPFFREKLSQLFGKSVQELGLLEQAVTQEDKTSELGKTVRENANIPSAQRAIACLSIVLGWVTGLLVLLFYRSSRFVVFYSLQSTFLFGATHVLTIVPALFPRPEPGQLSAASIVTGTIASVSILIALVAWIISLIQAARGKYFLFPIIGGYCERMASRLVH